MLRKTIGVAGLLAALSLGITGCDDRPMVNDENDAAGDRVGVNDEPDANDYEVRRTGAGERDGGLAGRDRDMDGRRGLNEVGDRYDGPQQDEKGLVQDKDQDGRTGFNEIGDEYDAEGVRKTGDEKAVGAGVMGGREVEKGVALLFSEDGTQKAGTIHFTDADDGVKVKTAFTGIQGTPKIKIADDGDCTQIAAAGGKDLLLDVTTDKGAEKTVQDVDLNGDQSIIGRAVIVTVSAEEGAKATTKGQTYCGVIGIDS